ncbi:hypothetical protein RO3G_09221 [Rhizopus delemar RA 99-880]|uniref:Uncharacterized protein n=1 Tax=Rhizopus delemar (strain RA 99-880 / ATCC MYA-4621 / FGSC 9543 / NRRL 43880) TaxID=246409 RepID=I1C7T1_RHIO9|nr:hypothetical protein RO3G_09221 [Rhizopus delemar RA 99-880]|eukprot:EIE84511.1 hypothetical protein RO3G_09221 [Rhizopus delemar RA 99-880]
MVFSISDDVHIIKKRGTSIKNATNNVINQKSIKERNKEDKFEYSFFGTPRRSKVNPYLAICFSSETISISFSTFDGL